MNTFKSGFYIWFSIIANISFSYKFWTFDSISNYSQWFFIANKYNIILEGIRLYYSQKDLFSSHYYKFVSYIY